MGTLGSKPQHAMLAKNLTMEFTGRLQGATGSRGSLEGKLVAAPMSQEVGANLPFC